MKFISFILAGGQGSRLNVLSDRRAKPGVPFGGIYRIIDFTLTNIMKSGVPHVGILTQYKPSSLMDHIYNGAAWDFAGIYRTIKILPPLQGREDSDFYKGTADAIYQNRNFIRYFNPEHVLILSGDHIYSTDYADLIKKHLETDADLTIAAKKVPIEDASQFGVMITDENSKILEFQEKSKEPKSNLASLGIYIFKSSKLVKRLKEDSKDQNSTNDFGKDIIPKMIELDNVYSYEFDGYWRDVGTIASYWQANMDLLKELDDFNLRKWKVRTNMEERFRIGDRVPAWFFKSSDVNNSMISRGCIIKGKVINSILSPGVIVEKGAEIRDSIIMHDTVIGKNAFLEKVIIDKECKIGNNVKFLLKDIELFNRKFPLHLDTGISLIGKGVTIPPKTSFHSNCLIYPGVLENKFTKLIYPSGSTIKS